MGGSYAAAKGTVGPFTCKIVGNRWYHTGALANGLTIEEIWERVEREAF